MSRIELACVALVGLFLMLPSRAASQIAIGVQAGTTGVGGSVALGLRPSLVLRGSANFFPFEPEFEFDGINYTTELPTPQFLVTGDFHPGGGGFYLSGGLHFIPDEFKVTAEPTENVEIGEQTYTPQQIGTLVGTAEGNSVAPYVGIGFGNPVGRNRNVGFQVDVGVSFIGEPDFELGHEGGDLSPEEEEALRLDLAREARNAEEDAPGIYPVVSIGLSVKLGR